MADHWIHEDVRANGIRFHCVRAGEGPLVLLLHGFPECWYSWRHQIPTLAGDGFTVVAPDLRGYNLTEKPVSGYDITTLSRDVLGLMDHYGAEKAVVAGHDWGGAVAWNTAIQHPDRVSRLIALNMPHPVLLARNLLTNPRQMLRSLYIPFFRLPRIPEWALSAADNRLIVWMIRGIAVHPERFTDEDMATYKKAAKQPGALTAALNYYRSVKPRDLPTLARMTTKLPVPTLMVWGEKDTALGKELTHGTAELVPDLELHYIPDASHWVQQDEPEQVTQLMRDYLRRRRPE